MRLMTKAGEVIEERGIGLIPTYRYTRFGSLRSDINVEPKLYDLLQDILRVRPEFIYNIHIEFELDK